MYIPIELVKYILKFYEEYIIFGQRNRIVFIKKLLQIPRPYCAGIQHLYTPAERFYIIRIKRILIYYQYDGFNHHELIYQLVRPIKTFFYLNWFNFPIF